MSNDGTRTQFKLWVPVSLKEALVAAGKKNFRSANNEATHRLIVSFIGKPRVRIKMGRSMEIAS